MTDCRSSTPSLSSSPPSPPPSPPPPSPLPSPPPSSSPPPSASPLGVAGCTQGALPACGCSLDGQSWCRAAQHCYATYDPHWMTDCRSSTPSPSSSPPLPSAASPSPLSSPPPPSSTNGGEWQDLGN